MAKSGRALFDGHCSMTPTDWHISSRRLRTDPTYAFTIRAPGRVFGEVGPWESPVTFRGAPEGGGDGMA